MLGSLLTSSVIAAYVLFIVFYAVMEFLISAGSNAIASKFVYLLVCVLCSMKDAHFGVIFSVNTFLSVFVQVIAQASMNVGVFSVHQQYLWFFIQLLLVATLFVAWKNLYHGNSLIAWSAPPK